MSTILAPLLFALLLWWFSTGLILYLDGLPEHTYRWSLLGATLLAIPSLWGIVVFSQQETLLATYAVFTCALLFWGWVEMSFLLGFITGSRRTGCPPGARGWRRFGYAWQALSHHELTLFAALLAVVALTWDAANPVALWTFTSLWLMRLSTKLNIFLGVRNLSENWLPLRLRYLQTYFTLKPMNWLFPLSITAATAAAFLVFRAALAPELPPHEATALVLVGTLLALGILEHWFLVLPVTIDTLFRWGFRSREGSGQVSERATADAQQVKIRG